MDIISHTLSGLAAGTVVATISNQSWKGKGLIILAGTLGGALPDFDALSLWSKFDVTIGAILGLSHSGKEIYFGKFWYSHHAALHSLMAPLIFILFAAIFACLFRKNLSLRSVLQNIFRNRYRNLAFFFGFFFHLLEDMPTPASVWGGVNLFFPSSSYVGGFGNIWWWNNYDLVLIIVGVILLNLCINGLPSRFYHFKVKSSLSVMLLGITLFIVQINTRPVDFAYSGHTSQYDEFEQQSKELQKEILGEGLYSTMEAIDHKTPLNF